VNDPGGIRRTARYKFSFVGHPSDDFKAELESSAIQGIELSDIRARDQFFDEDRYTVEKRKIIQLKLRDKDFPIWDALTSVGRRASQEQLESMRVKFTDTHQSTYTVEMNTSTLRLVNEDKYVKKIRLEGFTGRLNTASEEINREIRDKLSALI
jgi:DNA-binding response OmpR family regulator